MNQRIQEFLRFTICRTDGWTHASHWLGALPNPTNAAVAEHVWVGIDFGVTEVDPKTFEVEAVYEVFPGLSGAVRASSHAVWIRSDGGPFLTHIDPSTGEVVEITTSPALTSGGDVIEMGDQPWASAYDGKRIVRLSP